MPKTKQFLASAGEVSYFGLRAIASAFAPPYEWAASLQQLEEIGARSVPLIPAAGLALGVMLTLHTHDTLIKFGAVALSPTLQAASFITELGPLVTALLIAGRVGSGIGAELANLRATEQIDAIDARSVDSFKMLVVTRVTANPCFRNAFRPPESASIVPTRRFSNSTDSREVRKWFPESQETTSRSEGNRRFAAVRLYRDPRGRN